MGFWDSVKRSVGNVLLTPRVTYLGWPSGGEAAAILGASADPLNLTVAQMWRTQPHLRTVVSFRARNVAQLGLHVFERVSDTDRRRDHSSPLARALRRPDPLMTVYDLIFSLVGDLDLYDRAYWLITQDRDTGAPMLRRVPPSWVEPVFKDPYTISEYRVVSGDKYVRVPADQVLAFNGYSPASPVGASPTVEALRETLKEQIEASLYRSQVWKRGGRVSAVIERPAGARPWSDGQREAFREDWYAKYTGSGPLAGGTPILEEGMKLNRIDFTAQEQQFVDAAKLALATVAAAFHVNPTMVGQMDNANYSNVREFRRMLYGDTLGPLLAQIEARINTFLVPALGMDPDRYYVEFNLAEKLQGSFEEQAAVMQTMVGAPIMTRNEARARFNLPQADGADSLVTPLNVLVGGQASPTDSGSQNRRSSADVLVKARAPKPYTDRVAEVLDDHFRRQSAAVLSALGAKADGDWWDGDRWDRELTEDLVRLAHLVADEIGRSAAESLGFAPGGYDVDRTRAFLRRVAESRAGMINGATRDAVEAALASDDEDVTPARVFEDARTQRVGAAAAALVTTFSAFATTEAGRQLAPGRAMKTWVVTSTNPRPSHAAMNGQTVPVDEPFSNGMDWPGDPSGGADEVAGCECAVDVSY